MKNLDHKKGGMVISLDFELFWGVRDKRTITSYGAEIKKVKQVIPVLLQKFAQYDVKATFATVGFLFASDKNQLKTYTPPILPHYDDPNLSPYTDNFSGVGAQASEDPYHYALDLIKMIKEQPQHEISTHTFSHFYALEEGQTSEAFEADIKAAIAIAKKEELNLESIVFPRNQFNKAYAAILVENGIKSYRGNERVWFQKYQSEADTTLLKRVFRTANCYLNLSGHHCYAWEELAKASLPLDIPSSRFLRPYQNKFPFLRRLQLQRIKQSMTFAAKHKLLYHLWWHPHNFGANTTENFLMLDAVLQHYAKLNTQYGFGSYTMKGVADQLLAIKQNA